MLTTIFLISLFPVEGQQVEIRSEIGIGTYSMSDFKGLLEQSVLNSPIGLKTTQKFPAYAFYGVDAICSVSSKLGLGISTGFYSTGGRNDYSDYSGSYREDILVQSINLGLLASYKSSFGSNFFYNVELTSGIKFSDISNVNDFKISDYHESSSYDFKSKGWWLEPKLSIGRKIFRDLSCSAFVGYEYNLKSKLESDDINTSESSTKIDWSGIRGCLGIAYSFSFK